MMRSQVESGIELFTRLNTKSSLCGLEDSLLFEGLRNTDVIEIDGEQSTGKTLLVSRILAKCILPNDRQIQGCNAPVILINTDHHFQISKLVESMSNIINDASTSSFASKSIDTDFDADAAVIRNSLRNLQVIDCYNSEQFSLTLHALEDILLSNAGTALLAVDSITAYYWQDREINVIATIDSHVKRLLKVIRAQATRFNMVTLYTRPCENIGKKEKKCPTYFSGNNVNYKIHLCRTNDPKKFLCTVETVRAVKKVYYSILPYGIKWNTDKKE